MQNFNKLVPAETERLFHLVEEMGEALQAVGKIGRHGYDSHNPYKNGPDNRAMLERELGHVLYTIKTMAAKFDIEWGKVEAESIIKAETVKPYYHHQS